MEDMSANPASGSEQDPVALIERQLEREQTPPTERPRDQTGKFASQTPDPAPEPEPDENPDAVPEPGPEEPPVDPEGDEDDGEGEEQPEQQEEAETELYTIKVDGKLQQVTRDELLAGYQRQADYSRKTQELAEQRRAAEAEFQRIAGERQHYAQQLDQLATVLQTTLPQRPSPQDFDADPIGSLQQEKLWEAKIGQLQHVLTERDRAQQLNQQQMAAMQQQMLHQAKERLTEMLPEWRKPEVAKREQRELAEYLRSTLGYTDDEISAAADPRAIVGYRKAMLYDRLMAAKPTVQQRVAQAPKMVRPGSSGPAPDRSKQIVKHIRASGGKDLDAVARLIEMG